MAERVIEMHFVCRDDLNVTDLGDGTFETGVWYVSAEAARTVRTVALHQDKKHPLLPPGPGDPANDHRLRRKGPLRLPCPGGRSAPRLGWRRQRRERLRVRLGAPVASVAFV